MNAAEESKIKQRDEENTADSIRFDFFERGQSSHYEGCCLLHEDERRN